MSVVKQSGVAYPFTVVEPLFTSASSAVANCDDVREVILVRNGSSDKMVTIYFECNENAPRPTTPAQTIGPATEYVLAVDSALLKKADGSFSLVAIPPTGASLSACSFSIASIGMRQTPLY